MNNTYLVIFSAHVDSEIKKNETIETLKHLKESNIDVCLSTHSNLYLDELSKYVKYVVYDDNNEFLKLQDYLDNSNYIEQSGTFGLSTSICDLGGRVCTINIPSPHSKSVLSLFRNGVALSGLNNYKWTIYLEYDVKIPKLGFKHFFEYHIDNLIKSGKKCSHYRYKKEFLDFFWGGPFVFETIPIFNHENLMKKDWYSNKKKWIETWDVAFFEPILERCINEVFHKDEIIEDLITNSFKFFWNLKDVNQIGKFNYAESVYKENKYLKSKLMIHLFPRINELGNIELYLCYFNSGNFKLILEEILVYSDHLLHLNKKNILLDSEYWGVVPIDISKLSTEDTITLSWKAKFDNEYYTKSEYIKVNNLESIHKNIMRVSIN